MQYPVVVWVIVPYETRHLDLDGAISGQWQEGFWEMVVAWPCNTQHRTVEHHMRYEYSSSGTHLKMIIIITAMKLMPYISCSWRDVSFITPHVLPSFVFTIRNALRAVGYSAQLDSTTIGEDRGHGTRDWHSILSLAYINDGQPPVQIVHSPKYMFAYRAVTHFVSVISNTN